MELLTETWHMVWNQTSYHVPHMPLLQSILTNCFDGTAHLFYCEVTTSQGGGGGGETSIDWDMGCAILLRILLSLENKFLGLFYSL